MTASREPINPAKSPNCGEEVGEVKEKCPIYVRAFFIGGAGDKRKYKIIGIINAGGPTYIMDQVKYLVDSEVDPMDSKNRYESYYLGFEEACGNKDINEHVTAKIPDATTHVYIVGHSLGGWNGAHLSQILTDNGYKVKMLITLDPVGTSPLVKVNSDIYWDTPTPKAEKWINLRADPTNSNFSDTVANTGGRWVIDNNTVDTNHENAQQLFDTGGDSSAHSVMVQSILETIRSSP